MLSFGCELINDLVNILFLYKNQVTNIEQSKIGNYIKMK